MPAFMFLRIYEDFRWFIYEIRTSGVHNVRFRRSAPLSKTFALTVHSSYASQISLKFKNLH